MADAFTVKLNTAQVYAGLDDLQLRAHAEKRPAAQAAAQVFYEETKLRAPVGKAPRKSSNTGKTIYPGALRDSIYQVYSVDNSSDAVATYHVSWNARKAPHGHLVEFGGRGGRLPAHPFLRPAFDAALRFALEAANQRLAQGLTS